MRNEFTAMIEAVSEKGYFAYCLKIAGANAQGETIEECRQNLIEAMPAAGFAYALTVHYCVSVIYQTLFKSKTNPGSTFSPESCFGSSNTSTD